MKIVRGAVDALHGRAERLVLGSLDAKRDWSWAEDVVDGLIAMAERDAPEDYVLASGELHSTGDWVRRVFDKLGLSLERHFRLDPSRAHRGDRPHARGDIAAAVTELGWRPRVRFEEIVDRILATELESAERSARSSTASRREPKKNPGPT
jgi:GDPmannose 4,6-dehydratase